MCFVVLALLAFVAGFFSFKHFVLTYFVLKISVNRDETMPSLSWEMAVLSSYYQPRILTFLLGILDDRIFIKHAVQFNTCFGHILQMIIDVNI